MEEKKMYFFNVGTVKKIMCYLYRMYAELNPKINYDKASPYAPSTTNQQYVETPTFSKFQETHKQQPFSEYYIGGGSSAALRGLGYKNTPVSTEFFSDQNINRIQKKIKERIFELSHGKFKMGTDQNSQDLLIAMRAVYLDFNVGAMDAPTHVIRQVKMLNNNTLSYIIPDMMTNIKQQYKYLEEVNNPRKIMPRPLNVNKSQRGGLPSITTLWR